MGASNPTVCAIMLTRDRPKMALRAAKAFAAQTYPNRYLAVLDTSNLTSFATCDPDPARIWQASWEPECDQEAIGALRNRLIRQLISTRRFQPPLTDIICHWDDDDFSHPQRIAEQVALLQASGAECVGYREMLFWRKLTSEVQWHTHPEGCECGTCGPDRREVFAGTHDLGEAWLYTHPMATYALGTSLCYWRATWERNPFRDGNQEDFHFVQQVRTVGVSAAHTHSSHRPRMIASIHGSNTSSKIEAACDEWRRVPAFDEYCRRTMEGE